MESLYFLYDIFSSAAIGLMIVAIVLALSEKIKESILVAIISTIFIGIGTIFYLVDNTDSVVNDNTLVNGKTNKYEIVEYKAELKSGEIISAKSCEKFKDDKKVCEVLEYAFKDEGSKTETIEVVVDDYWEK